MANFTALKTAINNAIKTNGNEDITGAILQAILDAMVETLGDSAITDLENAITTEVTNRENAVGGVADDLAAEVQARANKDNQLDGRINQEEYNRQNADAALSRTVDQGFQTLNSQMTALNAAISALNDAYQNGFLYGGIATPSSSPSNNKCFYIALQGGTYTNFGGVGVVEGINIIKNDSGWKVEHIYDQTTLLNEFYLLRQQVIQAITSFTPIVIEGDVTNAPDEEDLTSNANHLLQFKNNAYSPLEFSGLGRKYLRKNIAPLSESVPFNGFVEGVTAEETLSGTPTQIFWDRMNTRFVGIKDGVYYLDWTDSDNYVPVSTSLVYMYNGTPYQWTGSDFIVDETEVPNLVNCLTQDMINEANTIYIIRYDYTLKEDITIPANCVLEFDGGSISGEFTLKGANTCIEAGLVKIFGTDIIGAGSWNITNVYPEWFGAKGDGTTDDSNAFAKALSFFNYKGAHIVLSCKTYAIASTINMTNCHNCVIDGKTYTRNAPYGKVPTLKVIADCDYAIQIVETVDRFGDFSGRSSGTNICIKGFRIDCNNHTTIAAINSAQDAFISYMRIDNSKGDGVIIECGGYPVKIEHCNIHTSKGHGVAAYAPYTTIYNIEDVQSENNDGYGFYIENGACVLMQEAIAQKNKKGGFCLKVPDPSLYSKAVYFNNITLLNCYAEANGTYEEEEPEYDGNYAIKIEGRSDLYITSLNIINSAFNRSPNGTKAIINYTTNTLLPYDIYSFFDPTTNGAFNINRIETGGIRFNDGDYLDDYKVGFTSSSAFKIRYTTGGVDTELTVSKKTLKYQKIGRTLLVYGSFKVTTVPPSGAQLRLVFDNFNTEFFNALIKVGDVIAGSTKRYFIALSGNILGFYKETDGVLSALAANQLVADDVVSFSCCIFTSDNN